MFPTKPFPRAELLLVTMFMVSVCREVAGGQIYKTVKRP